MPTASCMLSPDFFLLCSESAKTALYVHIQDAAVINRKVNPRPNTGVSPHGYASGGHVG